ncbi:MAG: hypothetical protein J6J23_02830 [Clostridia bacterium]|nr:hypothetical protein [Clostridia bacterium]
MSQRKEREKIIEKWNKFKSESYAKLNEQDLPGELYVAKLFQLEEDVKRAINMDLNNMRERRKKENNVFAVFFTVASALLVTSLIQAGFGLRFNEYHSPIKELPYKEETTPEEETDEVIYFQEM